MTSKEKEYLLSIANKFGTIDCEYLTSIDGEKMRKIVESVPVNYDGSKIDINSNSNSNSKDYELVEKYKNIVIESYPGMLPISEVLAINGVILTLLDMGWLQKLEEDAAEWIFDVKDGVTQKTMCSKCNYAVDGYSNTKFCPNCGRIMSGRKAV